MAPGGLGLGRPVNKGQAEGYRLVLGGLGSGPGRAAWKRADGLEHKRKPGGLAAFKETAVARGTQCLSGGAFRPGLQLLRPAFFRLTPLPAPALQRTQPAEKVGSGWGLEARRAPGVTGAWP